jgi:hypothetical protein
MKEIHGSRIKYQIRSCITRRYLKVMVCGSIGYGGVDEIRRMYSVLHRNGYEIIDHLVQKGMDYSDIRDFRDKRELSRKIVNHDLRCIKKIDVIIVLTNGPSYGAAIEMIIAKEMTKKVILLAKNPVPSPWPINFADYIVTSDNQLTKLLDNLQKNLG